MSNKYLLFFIWMFSGVAACASVEKDEPSLEKALLWEVSGGDLQAPSYIYGTFHLLCKDQLDFTELIAEKLDRCKRLVLEIDISQPELPVKMLSAMQMKDGKTLSDLYDSATYQQVDDSLKKYGKTNLAMVEQMKPIMLQSFLMMGLIDCDIASWEMELIARAKDKDMEIGELETIDNQASVFDSIPYALQADQLAAMMMNTDSTRQTLSTMITLYQHQDIEALYRGISDDPSLKPYQHLLLDNRNRNWIPKIVAMASEEPVFFAVGAGHLGGEKGLITLLRKEGYQVKPVLKR